MGYNTLLHQHFKGFCIRLSANFGRLQICKTTFSRNLKNKWRRTDQREFPIQRCSSFRICVTRSFAKTTRFTLEVTFLAVRFQSKLQVLLFISFNVLPPVHFQISRFNKIFCYFLFEIDVSIIIRHFANSFVSFSSQIFLE